MIRDLALESVVWDTAQASPPAPTRFFVDRPATGFQSITSTTEREIVHGLLSDRLTRNLILGVLGLPTDSRWSECTRYPFLGSAEDRPGDIDVLIAAPGQPHRAVAAEVKWVKVRSDGGGGQRINKLQSAGEGVEQAVSLLGLGFHRTFLTLLAVVDDRSDRTVNPLFHGATSLTLRRLIEFTETAALQPDLGILYVELAQPLAKDPRESSMVSAGVLRAATPRDQSEGLSAKVAAFLATKGRAG